MGIIGTSLFAFLFALLLSDVVLSASVDAVEKRTDHDSYIDALHKTHAEDALNSNAARSEYKDNSGSSHPGYSYGPPTSEYGPPTHEYGPPTAEYGPPSIEYGPPSGSYVPPSSSFAPSASYHYGQPSFGSRPINVYNYGPSPQKFPIVHSAPRDEHWLLDKFKFKLDLFTIGKILLKLIIFKKIVKFIALICLLLFLPKLQAKHMNVVDMLTGTDESEEETDVEEKRSFGQSRQRQINEVSRFAMTAIESFTDKHLIKCGNLSDIPCRFQSMVDVIDDKYPYERIVEMFVPINQYYAYAPQNQIKMRKKELKPQSAPETSPETFTDENTPSAATTPLYNEFSSSSSSSIDYDNSNTNRI